MQPGRLGVPGAAGGVFLGRSQIPGSPLESRGDTRTYGCPGVDGLEKGLPAPSFGLLKPSACSPGRSHPWGSPNPFSSSSPSPPSSPARSAPPAPCPAVPKGAPGGQRSSLRVLAGRGGVSQTRALCGSSRPRSAAALGAKTPPTTPVGCGTPEGCGEAAQGRWAPTQSGVTRGVPQGLSLSWGLGKSRGCREGPDLHTATNNYSSSITRQADSPAEPRNAALAPCLNP